MTGVWSQSMVARFASALLGGLLLVSGAPGAAGQGAFVIGDSLGVGLGAAGRVPSHARNAVTIRSPTAILQIRALPPGSIAFMSLGTNDAVGGAPDVTRAVGAIREAAREARVRLVWIGPPCVNRPWNVNSQAIDAQLRRLLEATEIVYVSVIDEVYCGAEMRARDGVHFTFSGYRQLWERARLAADYTPPEPPPAAVAAAVPPQPAPVPAVPPVPLPRPETTGRIASPPPARTAAAVRVRPPPEQRRRPPAPVRADAAPAPRAAAPARTEPFSLLQFLFPNAR